MFSRHWVTDNSGLWSLRKKQTESYDCTSLLSLGSVQDSVQGGRTQTELSGLSELGRLRLKIQEGKVAGICGTENQREGCCRMRKGEGKGEGEKGRGRGWERKRKSVCSSRYWQASLESLAEYRFTHAWRKRLKTTRKE